MAGNGNMIINKENIRTTEATDDTTKFEIPAKNKRFSLFSSLFPKKETFDDEMLIESGSTTLLIDESWILVGATSTPEIAGRVLELAKTIRGYNGILISASQDLADFLSLDDGHYGKGVINACRLKIIMQLEELEARLVKDILSLSDNEAAQITRNRRGEALLSIGNSRISLAVYFSAKEYDAITTASADIAERRERM
jgi:predicted DNA-binding protein (UPF0251 family)